MVKIFQEKKIIFNSLVAFLKIPQRIFQIFSYIIENVIETYFLLFSHIWSTYIIKKKENFRLKKNCGWELVVVGYWRRLWMLVEVVAGQQTMGMEGRGLIDKFFVKCKIKVLINFRHKCFNFTINRKTISDWPTFSIAPNTLKCKQKKKKIWNYFPWNQTQSKLWELWNFWKVKIWKLVFHFRVRLDAAEN